MTRSGASRYSPPIWRFRGFAAGSAPVILSDSWMMMAAADGRQVALAGILMNKSWTGSGLIPDRSSLLSRPSVPRAGRRPSGRLAGPGCRGPTARCRRSGWCRPTATERPSRRCSVRPGAFLDAHMPGPVSSSSSRWWSATIIRPRGCSPGWRRDESPHPDHNPPNRSGITARSETGSAGA